MYEDTTLDIQDHVSHQIARRRHTIVRTHGTIAYHFLTAKSYELAPMIGSTRNK